MFGRKSKKEIQELLDSFLKREPINDNEFIKQSGLAVTEDVLKLVNIVRSYLSCNSKIPKNNICPMDDFRKELLWLINYPEFEKNTIYQEVEDAIGIALSPGELEKIKDVSSPKRQGAVKDFVVEMLNVIETSRKLAETRYTGPTTS